jgi:nucleotide-binding universal stress UspA family protein
MKNIIVPVDFSSTSVNCAHYAVKMLTGIYDINLILFHVYDKSSEKETAEELLEKLRSELMNLGVAKISTHAEQNSDFPESLNRYARHMSAQLVVMGLEGRTRLEKIFLTSNTLKIVDRNPCPVMIIPPKAKFNNIKSVALTSDFKEVQTTIPVEPIRSIMRLFNPQLHIINVSTEHYVSLTEEMLAQRNKMAEWFAEFHPEFYFIGTYDFHDTLNTFVQDKKIDLVITIPRSRSFIDNIFKPSATKKIALESTVPVLAAHE